MPNFTAHKPKGRFFWFVFPYLIEIQTHTAHQIYKKMRLCGMNVRYHIGKCLWHISNALTHYLLIATKAYQQTKRTVPLVCACIVTSPKRRHKVRNFASLISARLAELLGIPFYEDIAECHSKHRVGAVFTFGAEPPKERNIIVFDDFVTTGATMISMRELLMPLGYNLVFFTGINNKL